MWQKFTILKSQIFPTLMAMSAIYLTVFCSEINLLAAYLPVYGGPTIVPGVGGYSITTNTGPLLVNNNGLALGNSFIMNSSGWTSEQRAVCWNASNINLGDPGHNSYTYGINDSGIAIGYIGGWSAGRAVKWNTSSNSITYLDNLGTSIGYSHATAINSTGIIAGSAEKADNLGNDLGPRAVRWDNSGTAATELDSISGTISSEANAINSISTIVGSAYIGSNNNRRAMRWDAYGTAITELGNLGINKSGYTDCQAFAINDSGTAIGIAKKYDISGNLLGYRAVRWDASGTTATELGNLGTLSSWDSFVHAINNAGTIVGRTENCAVRWDTSGTTATALGNLDPNNYKVVLTDASSINASGMIVGFAELNNYIDERAVFWGADGVAVDLNTLIDPNSGWTLVTAREISDTGWIIGNGMFDPDGPGGQDPYELHSFCKFPNLAYQFSLPALS